MFQDVGVIAEPQPDGGLLVRSDIELAPFDAAVCDPLWRWASETPNAVFLAERNLSDSWETITYADAAERVRHIAAGLIAFGLDRDHPMMFLCRNSINHCLFALAAMAVGIPYVPVTASYALSEHGREKLKVILDSIRPGLVVLDRWVAEAGPVLQGQKLLALGGEKSEAVLCPDDIIVDNLNGLEAAIVGVSPQDIAKIMMTSGSTGTPKGVMHTHRMVNGNVQMMAQMWPFLEKGPFVTVDWLPWSHCFGSNNNLGMTMRFGGSLYIDAGRPVSGSFQTTLRNLADVSPTIHFNVPSGLQLLADALEQDPKLAQNFFDRLDVIFYAGAALPENLFHRIRRAARAATGRSLPLVSGWGATETGPTATVVNRMADEPAGIGVPAPGVLLRLGPVDDKLELRVKSCCVTPGYWRNPELTAKAFDEDGFYRTGDAGMLIDENAPELGLAFDGRLSEDFKLNTGSWVSVGPLRTQLLTSVPGLREVVICAPNCPWLGLFVWLEPDADLTQFRAAISAHNHSRPGLSTAIKRVLVLDAPPSAIKGEVNDKGTLNQRKIVAHRPAELDRLYAENPDANVLCI